MRIHVTLDPREVGAVDEARGEVPRSVWIAGAIRQRLRGARLDHDLDSEDRSAAGDGGWSTKVVRAPEPAPSRTPPPIKKEQPVATVIPQGCSHPRDKRQVYGWGTLCGLCGGKVG